MTEFPGGEKGLNCNSREQWPFVSVVTLNFNGRLFLKRCLESILRSDYDNFEVILVDNASTDGSVGYVLENFGQFTKLRIVCNESNLGVPGGFNVGSRVAKGEYIVFQENDIEVEPGWLKELIKPMENDKTIGATQGKVLYMHEHNIIDSAGGLLDSCGLTYRRGHGERDKDQYNKVAEIFMVHSVAMAFRKSVLIKVGLFDPKFFLDKFDTDLCLRIWISGARVIYVPSSLTYHRGGGSAKEIAKRHDDATWTGHSTRALLLMALKNYQAVTLAKYLPLHLTLIFGYTLYKTFESRNPWYLWRTFTRPIIWSLLDFRRTWSDRLKVKSIRKVPDKEITKKFLLRPFRIQEFLCRLTAKNDSK
jgi:hypothetical protein